MERNVKVQVDPTVEELAVEFSNLNSESQVEFFNIVAKQFDSWGFDKKLAQLSFISDEKKLSFEAKDFISELNNYVNND